MRPSVEPLDRDATAADEGLLLHDPVESAQFVLQTADAVTPRAVDPDRLAVPIETAVAVDVAELTLPKRNTVYVRTPAGEFVAEFNAPIERRREEPTDRLLDVSTTSLKLYLEVPGPFVIETDDDARTTTIQLPERRAVLVGVRSLHERAATTIETPLESEPVMRALGASTAALKTISCERSFPTLRGHPPRLEPAEELAIPEGLDPPSPDIHVRVPPEWRYLYPVAPLAWYLGADLQPTQDDPVLEVRNWTFPLADDDRAFDERVHRALQQLFFMDCLVRTEGLYPVDLHEREQVEADLPVDLARLYDAPIEEQVWRYLSIPYSTIEDHLPTWHLLVDVEPVADHATALPYLLDDFALLRCPTREPATPDPRAVKAVEEFHRGGHRLGRGPDDGRVAASVSANLFTPQTAATMEHAYLGDGIPIGSNTVTAQSYERRLDHDGPDSPRRIAVQIVCNVPAMRDEDVVQEYYGIHDLLEFDVDVVYDLTRSELAEHLGADADLLHYVGHIDADGIECADGRLDARDLSTVGVQTFLLNACTSYEQGQALIDAGATAGVTTLARVGNSGATLLGRTVARALNAGFSLRSALTLAEFSTPTASQYVTIGDGSTQLVQCESGVPYLIDLRAVENLDGERFVNFDLISFPATSYGQGSLWSPRYATTQYLVYGHVDQYSLTVDELVEFLGVQSFPVTVDGTLYWSNALDRGRLSELVADLDSLRASGRRPTRIAKFLQGMQVER